MTGGFLYAIFVGLTYIHGKIHRVEAAHTAHTAEAESREQYADYTLCSV